MRYKLLMFFGLALLMSGCLPMLRQQEARIDIETKHLILYNTLVAVDVYMENKGPNDILLRRCSVSLISSDNEPLGDEKECFIASNEPKLVSLGDVLFEHIVFDVGKPVSANQVKIVIKTDYINIPLERI